MYTSSTWKIKKYLHMRLDRGSEPNYTYSVYNIRLFQVHSLLTDNV